MSPKKEYGHLRFTYLGSRFWYGVGFGAALLLLAGSAFLAYGGEVLSLERRLFLFVNGWPDSWRYSFLAITALGSSWMAAASVAAAFLAKLYWLAWRLAVALLAGYGAVFFLKSLISRPRPEGLISEAHIRTAETLSGFPSGHSMAVTVVVLSLLPYLPKFWCWFLILPVIAAVAASRLYLGVHVPLDVAGGVALGVLMVCAIRILPRQVRSRLRLG